MNYYPHTANTGRPLNVKSLNIGGISRPKKIKSRNVDQSPQDLKNEIYSEISDCREDLMNLLLLNTAIIKASALKLDYTDKAATYKALEQELDELATGEFNQAALHRVAGIARQLEFEIAKIDALFPQIIYRGGYMEKIASNMIENIGYAGNKKDAEVAYINLVSIEPYLNLEELCGDNQETSISAAMRTIGVLSEIAKFKNEIEAIYARDKDAQEKAKRKVLLGIGSTLLLMLIVFSIMSSSKGGWNAVKSIEVISIPLGVLIWSFIGSFAAMLEQFYRKPVYDFGSALKWIIVRPVLGVVIAAGVYLAFTSGFNMSHTDKEGGFMLFIAFMVGLSDSFALGLINKLRSAVEDSITVPTAKTTNSQAAAPMVVVPTTPATTVTATIPVPPMDSNTNIVPPAHDYFAEDEE